MTRLAHDWFPGELPENVFIGRDSWLHSSYAFLHYQSTLENGLRIGSHSGVYEGTYFDLGPSGSISIGSYTTIVSAIIRSNTSVEIGDYCLIAHGVILAEDPFGIPGVTAIVKEGSGRQREITVGRNCWIATGAILLGGARIGDDSIVGAQTVVDFEIPAGKMVVGNPPRILDLPKGEKSLSF